MGLTINGYSKNITSTLSMTPYVKIVERIVEVVDYCFMLLHENDF